ncbi:MAG: hypothetical protein ACLSHG_11295 [Oscillospiraceae bacterium]
MCRSSGSWPASCARVQGAEKHARSSAASCGRCTAAASQIV